MINGNKPAANRTEAVAKGESGNPATAQPAENPALARSGGGNGGVVSPARFELTAPGLGILCSILLSYGDTAPL